MRFGTTLALGGTIIGRLIGMDGNDIERDQSQRVCEMLTRIATIIAVLDFRDEVSLDDTIIAGSLAVQSFDVSVSGIDKYMTRFLDFPQYCAEVENLLRDGPMSKSALRVACRRFQRHGHEHDRVMAWLVSEGTVEDVADIREAGFGRPSPGYRLRPSE
jgi:hypothetical protein